jgi:hypothetical protein
MWPFNKLKHTDCQGHDFGEWKVSWRDAKIRKRSLPGNRVNGYVLEITPRKYKRCQREGCNEAKTKNGKKYFVPLSALSDFREKDKMEIIEEAADLHDNLNNIEDINRYRKLIADNLYRQNKND